MFKYMQQMGKFLMILAAVLPVIISSCMSFQKNDLPVHSPEQALQKLKRGNEIYINNRRNNADISKRLRHDTANNGQKPYAVIVTCSDSRVPPEHIFTAGIGDLFVIRTAGNTVDNIVLGSIEYGVKHLGAKIIVIMGHDHCGAVSAAIEGHTEGHITDVVEEIQSGIEGAVDASEAERFNIAHSYRKSRESLIIRELIEADEITVVQAKYDMYTGKADFFSN